MKLSIIVPIYNTEKYIKTCIESLINQIYRDIEIILVDDGSSDDCPIICDEYAKKDFRVKVVHKTNGGVVSARKAGFSASNGDYVTFVDGDDWIDCEYYNRILKQVGYLKPDLIKMPRYYISEDTTAVSVLYHSAEYVGYFDCQRLENEVLKSFLYKAPFFNFGITPSVWSCIFKRNVLEKYLSDVPNEICMGDDLAVTIPCAMEINDIYFSDVCGYYYRQNPTSITHVYKSQESCRINVLLNYLMKRIKPNSSCRFRYQVAMYAVYMVYQQLILLLMNSTNMQMDLEKAVDLLKNPLLLEGMKKCIPFKVRFAINSAQKNRKWALILLRKLLRRKKQ